ncbi:MAG: nitroreductase family protein [Acetobacterium sp.]|nr:nitroreductase family protein [Bacillota bacterium]MCG2730635.1 nitroreductase family protein [Acetobacterium sp.]
MLYDQLKTRRSIRKFKDLAVEQEKIEAILKSALMAPSSRGRRPWEFIAVIDNDLLTQLSLCRDHGSAFLKGVPLAIVVAADKEACDIWIEEASIVAILIQLAAQDLGLGSCWIQVRERYQSEQKKTEDYIKDCLSIPEQYAVECVIAIGYPDEVKKPHDENTLLYEKIHFNQFNDKMTKGN